MAGSVQGSEFEKLGVFYLGRKVDPIAGTTTEEPILYDSRDLVTHAVCIGMTGSGKTGLCTALLEEAAIDGVPALVIDPKGDMTNLLLAFPELKADDFRPWIDEDEAARRGVTSEQFAEEQAASWTEGLARWGEDGERIRRFKDAVDCRIFTPGSGAGMPVSILGSLTAPPPALAADKELLGDRVAIVVEGLLGLLGIDADPLMSREHILLSSLIAKAWAGGRDLDLTALIGLIQAPPLTKVGALDLDSFFSAADRTALAMRLNNLLAAPGFELWMQGEPLDAGRLLRSPSGRPRLSIFTLSHLSDQERMFFVTLLLNEVLGWMRTQEGTSSLRAILYMDEILGFLPPVANPPSKRPLLTMLKQARAYGLGIVLATQNPVDLDYKGLGNTGTWFIGRLQTDRDRARLWEGWGEAGLARAEDSESATGAAELPGGRAAPAVAEAPSGAPGTTASRAAAPPDLDALIAGLRKRVFLLRNIHDEQPVLFESRFALSYLRGPLTRAQIKRVTEAQAEAEGAGAPPGVKGAIAPGGASEAGVAAAPSAGPAGGEGGSPSGAPAPHGPAVVVAPGPGAPAPLAATTPATAVGSAAALSDVPPIVPPDVPTVVIPPVLPPAAGESLTYEARVLGRAEVHYVDARRSVDAPRSYTLLGAVAEGPLPLDWDRAEAVDVDLEHLGGEVSEAVRLGQAAAGSTAAGPAQTPRFATSAPAVLSAKSYGGWGKDLAAWLYHNETLRLQSSKELGVTSRPEETEHEFTARLEQSARERRDNRLAALEAKYTDKLARLDERIRKAEQAVERKEDQAKDHKMQTAVSFGATMLGAFLGRKAVSATTLGRATTAARGVSRSARAVEDVKRAEDTLETLKTQRKELSAEFETAAADLRFDLESLREDLEEVTVRPKKSDISVRLVALAWTPLWEDGMGRRRSAYRVPAAVEAGR